MISSKCIIPLLMIVVITHASSVTNSTKEVASEGDTQPKNKVSSSTTSPKDPPRMGREHVIDKLYTSTSIRPEMLGKPNKSENASTTSASVNGSFLQKSLNASDESKVVTMKINNSSITAVRAEASNSTTKDTAINSTTIIQKINGTSSITTTSKSTNITKSTTARPMKPTRTEHDDVVISEKIESHSPSIPSIDTTFEKKTKRADYVVPIVAVILSIPLVTIIFSVLLKRGKDWWQHRNYRRMDFLIEGMYNS